MSSIADVCQAMKTLFEEEGPQLAKACGLRERRIGLVKLAYLLVLGWWHLPHGGPSHLSRFAGSLGLNLSKQAIDSHFTEATASWLLMLLRRAVQVLVCAAPVDLPLLRQFRAVLIEDGSTISLPQALASVWQGDGGNASTTGKAVAHASSLQITLRYDLLGGSLDGPHLQAGRRHELSSILREQEVPTGSLWMADLGYWSLKWLRPLRQRGVHFLLRYKDSLVLWLGQRRLDVLSVAPCEVGARLELLVDVGASRQLCCVRLLIERVPDAVVSQRQKRLREAARIRREVVSERALQLAHWTMVLTTAPESLLTFSQVLALLRARWQIELLFKLWKSHALLDEWTGTKPFRVLCEVYAKLLAMVVQHWFLLLSCWDDPHHSLPAAADVLRSQVPVLVHGLMRRLPLEHALTLVVESVPATCTIPARADRLSTSRLIQRVWDDALT